MPTFQFTYTTRETPDFLPKEHPQYFHILHDPLLKNPPFRPQIIPPSPTLHPQPIHPAATALYFSPKEQTWG